MPGAECSRVRQHAPMPRPTPGSGNKQDEVDDVISFQIENLADNKLCHTEPFISQFGKINRKTAT